MYNLINFNVSITFVDEQETINKEIIYFELSLHREREY